MWHNFPLRYLVSRNRKRNILHPTVIRLSQQDLKTELDTKSDYIFHPSLQIQSQLHERDPQPVKALRILQSQYF